MIELLDDYNGVLAVDSARKQEYFATAQLMYAATLLALDDGVKQIYETLESTGAAENTIFIFASDNGAAYLPRPDSSPPEYEVIGSAGELRGQKGSPYQGGVHTANFVLWPARIAPEQVVTSNIWIGDLAATFLELAGLAVPVEFDGASIVGALTNDEPVIRRFGARRIMPYLRKFALNGDGPEGSATAAVVGIVTNNRKYIRSVYWDLAGNRLPFIREEMYNLRVDVGEAEDLAADPGSSVWLERARADFKAFRGDTIVEALPVIPKKDVWGDYVRTLDFGFEENGRVLETLLTP